MRPGEAWNLKWEDIDTYTKQVRITPEKGSNPRVLPLSNMALNLVSKQPRNNEFLFKRGQYRHFSECFRKQRKKLAVNLGKPDINRIQLKTFRHYKGTMEYHKTKDILNVKIVLGHRNIKNTLVYTHLINFRNDEYVSKVAKNADEACELIEAGFEFVCSTPDELLIFKKRK